MEHKIFYSKAGIRIVTSPFLVGPELEQLALQSSTDFLRQINVQNPVEVVILQGGKYYHLGDAYEKLHASRPQLCEIHSKRFFEEGWHARVWGLQSGLGGQKTLLVGDTIATGTTLQAVLEKVIDASVEADAKLNDIYIFSIAGAGKGEEKISKLDAKLAPLGAQVRMFYANARFGLADNGTDLLFDSAEYYPQAKAEIDQILGPFSSKMKCAIWDWGDRFTNPAHHLHEAFEYYKSVNAPAWILDGFKQRMAE